MANAIWKRPKVNDDEEEILRQQEEFLKEKQHHPQLQSKNLERKSGAKQDIVSTSQDSGEMINPAIKDKTQEGKREDMVQNIPIVSSNIILGNIVEKNLDIEKYKFDNDHISTASELGFPQVFTFDNVTFTEKKTTKQSLFGQKVLALKSAKHLQKSDFETCKDEFSHKKTSDIVEDQLASEINRENLEKLANMSEAEILEEKRKLEETLEPKLIQFLKDRHRERKLERLSGKRLFEQDNARHVLDTNKIVDMEVFNETPMDMEISDDKKLKSSSNDNDTKMDCKDDTLSIPLSSKELLEEGKQRGWLHMDTPEPDKLKWMEDLLNEKKDESAPNEEYNARFDFNGLLLPYKDENITVDKGLYHHGEEPERPGYSLQELLQLSRSSAQQQRCTALTTLANIMEKTHVGWYDKALHPSPLTALSQKNILLLLRFSLDDPSVAVVTASLEALRAFLVTEADEICLDRLFGFKGYIEPTLAPQLEDKDTSSLKDHELAQVDAVAALLRSDILLRIRYILSEMRPPSIGVICALEILIRLARHSHETALNISSTPYLLDTIIRNFIPLSLDRLAMQDHADNIYGIPVTKAIKLCRVLVTYGKKPVAQKLDNFKIIQTIITYTSSDIVGGCSTTDDVRRSIEILRLWQIMLHYETGLDSVAGAQLTLIAQLKLWLDYFDIRHSTELDCERAAALIAVAGHEKMLHSTIESLSGKWSRQFLLILKPTWGMMKLRAVVLSLHRNLIGIPTFVIGISRFWLSEQHIFSTLCSDSNLLSNSNPAIDREPSCLRNLDVLTENGDMQPIVSVNSCIPFLSVILDVFCFKLGNINIRMILETPNILKYLQNLATAEWSLERSWYSRTELYLLTALVKAAASISDLAEEQKEIIWKIAVKLISALPADITSHVSKLLEIALFNKKTVMTIAVLGVFELNFGPMLDQFRVAHQGLRSDIVLLYDKYVPPNGHWDQAAMPKDWLFLPLVHVYTKCKNDIKLEPEDKDSVLAVLKATFAPDLMATLSPTLKFSRLILLYFCDTLYLDEDVATVLWNVQTLLLKSCHARLNFQMELPGVTSFTDLFTALCEHFCASSYGNDTFAIALLVPIAQRHDAHYRKLLWSEHAAVLRYLRLPLERLMKVLPIREYLYPEEEDTSLIDSYITALVRGTITETWCPVPYAIALHHAAMYLKRGNKLAVRMRTQVEKLQNRDLADRLLNFEPLPRFRT